MFEGRTWCFQTIQEIADHFPYLTYKMVKRVINSLEQKNVIIKSNFHKDPLKKTNWYAFVNELEFSINVYEEPKRALESPNGPMESPNGPILYKEEDTNTEDIYSLSNAHAREEDRFGGADKAKEPPLPESDSDLQKGVHKLGTLPKKEILEAEDGLPSINLSAVQIDVMTKQAMDEGLTIEEAKPLVKEVILAYRLECGANQCMHDKPYFAIRKWLIHAVKKYKDEKSKGHKLKLSVTPPPESEQSPANLLKKRPDILPFSKEALDKFFS